MENLSNYEKEVRQWGDFERFTLNEKTTVKIITVSAGESISLQTHNCRDEFWRVIKGDGTIEIGNEKHLANEGDSFFVFKQSKHRAVGGENGMTFLEISFGEFDEKDIIRLDDKYGRV